MGNKKEEWLDPWSDAYHLHQAPVREALATKDPQKSLQAIHEHLPEMIAIRDEVAALPIPNGFKKGIFSQITNGLFGLKNSDVLRAEREGTLQAWNETIGKVPERAEEARIWPTLKAPSRIWLLGGPSVYFLHQT